MLQQQQQRDEQSKKHEAALVQNIAYNTQSTFISYFSNFQVPFDISRDLIMHFSAQYRFDPSRTHLLLSELERHQKNMNYKVTKNDRR